MANGMRQRRDRRGEINVKLWSKEREQMSRISEIWMQKMIGRRRERKRDEMAGGERTEIVDERVCHFEWCLCVYSCMHQHQALLLFYPPIL